MQGRTEDLFADAAAEIRNEELAPGASLLHGFALEQDAALLAAIHTIAATAPFRQWQTPGGLTMSVSMTNCGRLGWVSDRRGYRYQGTDPASGQPWPAMPPNFRELAEAAAAAAGFARFSPDACLINRYLPGTRMSLHQDKDESDFSAPIVSVSLGLPAIFQFGGDTRSAKPLRVPLIHGDVVVWGGPARLRYHGISPIKQGHHSLVGAQRMNLTFRRAE
jgi:alkylated DNA repair protein (DNA oxidative demethylase)